MTAERITRALGGRKVGSGWMARCPVHDDRNPGGATTDECESEKRLIEGVDGVRPK